jgi:hypothetical protein
MTSNPGPSPAWLGVFAGASFAGLVLASFASGHHLVGGTAPTAVAASATGADRASAAAATTAIVREPSRGGRLEVRTEPETGKVIDQLKLEQRVTLLAQNGAWSQIRYERDKVVRLGWTRTENLTVP